MESGAVNNFHVIEKQINKFDGRRVDEFLEWDSKLRASLSVYNKTTFNATRQLSTPYKCRSGRQSLMSTRRLLARPGQETTRATWDVPNQDLYSVLFSTTAGSAFSMV